MLVGLAAALVAAGGGYAAVTLPAEPAPPAPVVVPTVAPVPVRGPLLAPLDPAAPLPGGLQAVLDGALADPALAPGLAGLVVDAETGEVLAQRRATEPVLPASTAKLVTAAAALVALGPDTRLATRVVAGAAPGEIVLVGGGDTTLAGPLAAPGEGARLSSLAAEVAAQLTAPVTRVLVDDTLYSGPTTAPGWRPNYVPDGEVAPVSALSVDAGRVVPGEAARVDDPALAAGTALAAALGVPGVPVERGTAGSGAVLAEVLSPPVARLAEIGLLRSDNDVMESLARQVALATGRPATFTGASAALAEVAAELGLEVRVDDGSGLSRDSRLAPAATVQLLRLATADPRLAPVLSGLPVAGVVGTLARRYGDGPQASAAGVVRGKTGTLSGLSALAGLVRTADGRLLAFDLVADAVPEGAGRQAEAALDRVAATIAACGC